MPQARHGLAPGGNQGATLAALGRDEQAEAAFVEGLRIVQEVLGADDPRTHEAAERLDAFRSVKLTPAVTSP